MGTFAPYRSLHYYFKRAYVISDFSRKMFVGGLYYSNANYYKAVLGQYVNFKSYINIYKGSLDRRSIHTDIDIQSDILGADSKDILARYGKPEFIFHEKALSVFVYKWRLNGLRTRCEVHFYKHKAFLMNYIYNQLSRNEVEYISNSFVTKYLDQQVSEVDLMTAKISDKNNNILFMDNFLVGMKVTYMSNCESDWFEAMGTYVDEITAKREEKARVNERRFFNRI
jgi:hypothetical protein